ncbi:MFS-type transporter SLC18B1-like isoform X1 [Symsagittifera roscoffensis]|uniref:MFS-type transporter SLC18B1-like isoform X1 n=1 Tax=Symsagittifera roscoffensis TaxID=84072 RepID=UPI00307C91A5
MDVSCLIAAFLVGSHTTPENTKTVSITGTLLCAVTIAVFGLLTFISGSSLYFASCILARAVNGVGVAMTFAMLTPIPLKCFPEKAGLMAGIIQTSFCLGVFSGPIIGSILIPYGGYTAPFIFSGATEALFSFLAIFIFPSLTNSTVNNKHNRKSSSGGYLKFLAKFSTMSVVIPSSVVFFMSGFRNAAFSLHFQEAIGIDIGSMGFVFVSNAITAGITGAVVATLVERGFGTFVMISSQVLIVATAFAMFLPHFVPQMESTIWAVIILAINGISVDGMMNPFYLIIQKLAVKDASADSIEQVRTFASVSFSIMMSSGRIFGAIVLGGFVNEQVGFYWTSLIYGAIALCTASWHILFLARASLLGRVYYPTSLERAE